MPLKIVNFKASYPQPYKYNAKIPSSAAGSHGKNGPEKYFKKDGKCGLTYGIAHAIIITQGGEQPPRKEAAPMSITDTIALLMLVLAAVSLGIQIKK